MAYRLYFIEISIDGDNWSALYQDSDDLRCWELIYPLGNMHGGGPPKLNVIEPENI